MGDYDILAQIKRFSNPARFSKNIAVDYHPEWLSGISLSAGYKEVPITRSIDGGFEQTLESNIVLGFGLELGGLYFDYAFEKSEHILFDNKHYFSVGFSF